MLKIGPFQEPNDENHQGKSNRNGNAAVSCTSLRIVFPLSVLPLASKQAQSLDPLSFFKLNETKHFCLD